MLGLIQSKVVDLSSFRIFSRLSKKPNVTHTDRFFLLTQGQIVKVCVGGLGSNYMQLRYLLYLVFHLYNLFFSFISDLSHGIDLFLFSLQVQFP